MYAVTAVKSSPHNDMIMRMVLSSINNAASIAIETKSDAMATPIVASVPRDICIMRTRSMMALSLDVSSGGRFIVRV